MPFFCVILALHLGHRIFFPVAVLFSSKSVLGRGLKHRKLRNLREKGVHFYRSTRRGVGQCKEDLRRHYARNVEHVQPIPNPCIASNEGQHTTRFTDNERLV